MPQTRPNGAIVPVGSDPYSLPSDMAIFADSLNLLIKVDSKAERDALVEPYEGMTVIRLDLNGELNSYVGGAWRERKARAQVGYASGSTRYSESFAAPEVQQVAPGFFYVSGMFKPGTSADATALVQVPLGTGPSAITNHGVFYRTTGNTYGIAFAQLSTDRWMRFYGLPGTADYVSMSFGWWGSIA